MINLTPFFQKHLPQIFKAQPAQTDSLRPENDGNKQPRGAINLSFWLEDQVSVFADIILTLQQEIFRRGFKWTHRWAQKCTVCGAKYHEKKIVCDCGASAMTMVEPDSSQIMMFNHDDGKSFLEQANLNNTSLKIICRDAHRNLNISDRGYILIIKKYLQDMAGNIISATPVEILSIDPRTITEIQQKNGLPGGKFWTCLEHRNVIEQNEGQCPLCGKVLYDVLYETTDKKYYVQGEVRPFNLYYLNGYPPILKVLDDAMAYQFLEKRTRNTYEKGRGAGIFMFPTNNAASLAETWNQVNAKWQEDPDFVPAIGYDAGQGKGTAQYIKLLDDPNPALLEVKKDIRERLMSFFEISPLFMADTSASGGLNNEGQQITVTNRGIEFNQSVWNGDPETFFADGVLAWICDQFGITDYVLQLNPSEEHDEMAEKQRFSQAVWNAKVMFDMGFDIKFENNEFVFSGQAVKPPAPVPFGGGGFGGGGGGGQKPAVAGGGGEKDAVSADSIGANIGSTANGPPSAAGSGEKGPNIPGLGKMQGFDIKNSVPDELDEYQGDQLIKSYASDALKAIRSGALYSFYKDVPERDIPIIHSIIEDMFMSHRLSLNEMVAHIVEKTSLDEIKARMIARTESTGVAMKAREIGWKRMEEDRGETFLYKAVITHDMRTSPVSRRIEAAVSAEGGAVTLDRLKEIYMEESTKPYIKGDLEGSGMGADWTGWENFVGHPWERDSIVRVVSP
jgi:hypothetical protein